MRDTMHTSDLDCSLLSNLISYNKQGLLIIMGVNEHDYNYSIDSWSASFEC